MFGLWRLHIPGAGASVPEHAAAFDEPLGLLVDALRERQDCEVQVLDALKRQVLELVEAEVPRVGPRVVFEIPRVGARVRARGDVLSPRLVQRVLSTARLQLDRL